MTPPAEYPGYRPNFGKGLVALFKRAMWEIPDVMCTSFVALVGVGMAWYGCYHYKKIHGENSEFKSVYYIVRDNDPRQCQLKNPARTEYTCKL